MFKHDSCNKEVVEECLKRISFVRDNKSNSIFDDFYRSHLDCFESLIEDWKDLENNSFAVIVCRKGHKNSDNTYSPVYATICMKDHWTDEGVMLTSGLYDATKFDLTSEDLYIFLKYCNSTFKNREFSIIYLDKSIFGDKPRELWSDDIVNCGFTKSGVFKGINLK